MISDKFKKIREDFDINMMLEASAGTGKTTSLVSRLVGAMLEKGYSPEKIAAITFTNKAADEMKTRALESLLRMQACDDKEKAKKASQLLLKLSNCKISTIHSFCRDILCEFPQETGYDMDLKILEEESGLFERIWLEYVNQGSENLSELFLIQSVIDIGMSGFKNFAEERIKYPELELVGAGVVPGYNELKSDIITGFERFIGNAGKYMEGCEHTDEDPFCRQLFRVKKVWERLKDSDDDDKFAFAASQRTMDAKPDCNANWKKSSKDEDGRNYGTIRKEEANAELAGIHREIPVYLFSLAKRIADEYGEFVDIYSKKHSYITFEESLLCVRNLLRENTYAREYLRDKYDFILVDEFQDTDPVQAEIIIWLSSEKESAPDDWKDLRPVKGKLFVVGDPKQSIFRFRRADIQAYEEFKRFFDKDELMQLDDNYRSAAGVVEFVNGHFSDVIKKNEEVSSPEYLHINPVRPERGGAFVLNMKLHTDDELARVDPAVFKGTKKIGMRADAIRSREADLTAWWIKNRLLNNDSYLIKPSKEDPARKIKPGDIMILFRMKRQVSKWAESLEKFNLPVENISGTNYFQREVVREGLMLLRAMAFPYDSAAVYSALKSPLFNLKDSDIFKLKSAWGSVILSPKKDRAGLSGDIIKAIDTLLEIKEISQKAPDSEKARIAFEASGYLSYYANTLDDKASSMALIKLTHLISDKVIDEGMDYGSALAALAEKPDEMNEADYYMEQEHPEGIRLMTIHKAKGLEAPVVILAESSHEEKDRTSRCIDRETDSLYRKLSCKRIGAGLLGKPVYEHTPVGWDEYAEAEYRASVEEEKRLRYVASTRARDYLFIPSNEWLSENTYYHKITDYIDKTSKKKNRIDIVFDNYSIPEVSDQKTEQAGKIIDQAELEKKIKEFSVPSYKRVTPSQVEGQEDLEKVGYGPEHGTDVHAILEYLMKNHDKRPKDLDYSGLHLPDTARQHVHNAFNSDEWKRAMKSEKTLSELPFGLYENDELVNGYIDLVFKEPDGWVIVDYKTNKIDNDENLEELEKHYAPQMEMYKKYFEKLTGEKVKETKLLFLDIL